MTVTFEEMRKINLVQIEILREVSRVCDELGIVFYMVHGSLLGTVRNGEFVPGDDDIDIAMPREMYNVFLSRGREIINKNFFIQNEFSEPNYIASFAKVRDSRTTYIIDSTRDLKMNHGIYIDIFPIDNNYPIGLRSKLYNFKSKVLSLRLSNYTMDNEKIMRRVARYLSRAFYPTKSIALKRRNALIKSVENTGFVGLTGGKSNEQSIPATWFVPEVSVFEGVEVHIPKGYDKYLKQIYGDYFARTLLEGKTDKNGKIELNAVCVDIENPYTDHI